MDTSILTTAIAVTLYVKILVDVVKISPIPSPSASVPLIALGLSLAVSFVYVMAQGIALTKQTASQTVLVAILAFGGAVGVTKLQDKATATIKP